MDTPGSRVAPLALTAALAAGSAAAQTPIPIEHFAAGSEMISPSMSPDGTRLVYVAYAQGKPFIIVDDLNATKPPKARPVLSGVSDQYVAKWCAFKSDERILCSFHGFDYHAGRPYGTTRLVALNADGSKIKAVLQSSESARTQFQDRILHWLPDDPEHVVIALDEGDDIYPSVYKLNIYIGTKRVVQPQRQPVMSWMSDRSGAVRFGYGFHSASTTGMYMTRPDADTPWKVIEKFDRYEDSTFSPLGFGVRPNTMVVSAPHNGYSAIWEFDLAAPDNVQLLFSRPDADVDDSITWHWDQRLLGFRYDTDRPQAYYIDDLARKVDATMRKVLPDRFSQIVGGSRDGKRLLIGAYSDVKPPTYYVLDIDALKIDAVGLANPALEKANLAPMKTIGVPSGNVSVPGYLTVPVGKEPKNLPMVVLPHGGPYARDTWGYDPLVQMLASRGYAVLQLNFRGSTGFGREWRQAGWREWGGVTQDDITAGARWAVAQGIADPKRTCIVGWSYGGYSALLGVSREPDLYRCAVSIAGVSDLNALSKEERFFYGGRVAARESIGADRKELKEDSPLQHAGKIKVPVLLIHGEADPVVLSDHSETMAKALRKQKVSVELLLIKDGGHDLGTPEMRLTLFRKLEAFLAQNLAGR